MQTTQDAAPAGWLPRYGRPLPDGFAATLSIGLGCTANLLASDIALLMLFRTRGVSQSLRYSPQLLHCQLGGGVFGKSDGAAFSGGPILINGISCMIRRLVKGADVKVSLASHFSTEPDAVAMSSAGWSLPSRSAPEVWRLVKPGK